ncbi:hypothetical protein BVIET440_20342 [Burkholderia vietnamiensis]|nr:hypothetical protein BVI2075_1210020 [Burkholderia vietnamiensis]CAG9192358.1 hypothetical protein BVI434_1100017 [Burkholderia vietnamiensis]CAG9204212.1 hypothetical protein BVI1335_170020 [Burkholderia vietnamiensis]
MRFMSQSAMTGSPFVDSAKTLAASIAASREWHAMHACIGLVAPYCGDPGATS